MSGACGGPGAPAMPPVGQDPSTGRETVTQNRSVRDWTQRPRPAQDLHVSQVSLDCSIIFLKVGHYRYIRTIDPDNRKKTQI